MTRMTLEEVRRAFKNRITIWGGIPSTQLCIGSTTDDEFRRYTGELLARYGHADRLVLGVSDMVTADAELDRIKYLCDRINSLS
jgi:hypothetical protein